MNKRFKIREYNLEEEKIFHVFATNFGNNNIEKIIFRGTIEYVGEEKFNPQANRIINILGNIPENRYDLRDNNKTLIISMPVRVEIELSEEEKKQKILNKFFEEIGDDFNLATHLNDRTFVFPDNPDAESVYLTQLTSNDLEVITDAIADYIKDHQGEFNLSNTTQSLTQMPRGIPRPWYSPLNPERDRLTYNAYNVGEEQANRMRYIEKGAGGQRRWLFPNFFSEQQYEKIKNSLGDNVSCKVPGCYNNYADTLNYDETNEVRVTNGRCGYHQRIENGDLPPPHQEPENQTAGNNSGSEREQIIRNALNDNSELKRMLEANNIDREYFVGMSLEEWINPDQTIDLEKIKQFFRENSWSIPEPEEPASNEEEAEDSSSSEPLNDGSDGHKSTSSDLSSFRTQTCQAISNALDQIPKISNSDLAEINRNWKEQINTTNNKDNIINIKDRVMADIAAKREAKKTAENIVENLSTEGKDAEQLKKQLEEVEKARGQQGYQDNQSGIDNLKDELVKKVSGEEYRQIIVNAAEETMVKYNIKPDELDTATKEEWQKLKGGGIKDPDQINEIEKKVIKNVGEKGSEKRLNLIFIEVYGALKSGKKDKIKKARDKLNSFMVSTDIYEKALLSRRENEVKKLLKDLENCSAQKETTSPTKFPQEMIIIVSLILLVSIVLGVIIYRKRKKRLQNM